MALCSEGSARAGEGQPRYFPSQLFQSNFVSIFFSASEPFPDLAIFLVDLSLSAPSQSLLKMKMKMEHAPIEILSCRCWRSERAWARHDAYATLRRD
jgi:hypothetical protein